MGHHRLPTIAAVCVAAVLAACSPTTYDSTADTQPREATSTTLPTGTAAELLPLLLAEVQGLPTRVMNADGGQMSEDIFPTRVGVNRSLVRPKCKL